MEIYFHYCKQLETGDRIVTLMFYKLIIFDPTVDPTYTNLIMIHYYD